MEYPMMPNAPAGLLGQMPNIDPQKAGLLAAAFRGLQASGPSRMPVTVGQSMGLAGEAGMNAQRMAQRDQMAQSQMGMQQQMMGMQYAQHAEALKAKQAQEKAINDFAMTLPPEKQAIFRANPSAFIQEMNKKYVVGNSLVPGNGGNPLFTAPKDPKTAADATGVLRYVDGPEKGKPVPGFETRKAPEGMQYGVGGALEAIPGYVAMKKEIGAASAPRIDNRTTFHQEKAEAKNVGEFFGKKYSEIQSAGFNATASISRANRLSQLLEGVQTGKLTPAQTEVQAIAASLGITIGKDLGAKQAAEALSNAMALELRNPAGGAGMPGAMSDADRQFLQGMVPGLGTSPEGRKLMVETSKKIAERDKVIARMARDYRTKNGSLDEGFFNKLEDFSNANPMFGGSTAPAAAAPAAAPKVVDFNALPKGGG